MVIGITSNMEPGAGIDQSWVPALKNIGGIIESASQGMQSISWNQTKLNHKIKTHKIHNPQKQNRKQTHKRGQVKWVPSEFVDKAGERKKRKEREKEIRERGEAIFREKTKGNGTS